MFSRKLPTILQQAERVGKMPSVPPKKFQALLEKGMRGRRLDDDELVELINGTLSGENQRLLLDFSANYKRPHHNDILLLPPLYFSSKCENQCLYCDFNNTDGFRLSYEEFLNEFDALLDMGYRSIELVSSQDPDLFIHRHGKEASSHEQLYDIHKVAKYFDLGKKRLAEKGGGMLTSNIPPVDGSSLKELKSAGLDCYLLWAETFNPAQYSSLHHLDRPKSDQAFRFDSFEKALEAGIGHVAGAFLKGLYDWRKEEVVLYLFDQFLKRTCGRGLSIIGTPRLKGPFARSNWVKPYQVSDEEYELNVALDRILFDGVLWLQTRETPSLNRRLIARYGGGVILTLDCSTAPGGYKSPSKGKAQFPVYRQNLSLAVRQLESDGYRVVFNWDHRTLSDFQRKD
jgi:2-iminoacetate synthase